jgi:hypothetical protein
MSFPRYPADKDSGVEWLGEVPEHWSVASLKHVADYQRVSFARSWRRARGTARPGGLRPHGPSGPLQRDQVTA